MSTNDDYEITEVQVSKKIEIKLTLDDLLNAVQQQANAVTSGTTQASPQVVDRLRQIEQLAQQVRGQLGGSA